MSAIADPVRRKWDEWARTPGLTVNLTIIELQRLYERVVNAAEASGQDPVIVAERALDVIDSTLSFDENLENLRANNIEVDTPEEAAARIDAMLRADLQRQAKELGLVVVDEEELDKLAEAEKLYRLLTETRRKLRLSEQERRTLTEQLHRTEAKITVTPPSAQPTPTPTMPAPLTPAQVRELQQFFNSNLQAQGIRPERFRGEFLTELEIIRAQRLGFNQARELIDRLAREIIQRELKPPRPARPTPEEAVEAAPTPITVQRRIVTKTCFLDPTELASTGLMPTLEQEASGHVHFFQVDAIQEAKMRAVFPPSWHPSYWDICPAHKRKLYRYTPDEYIRTSLRTGQISELDLVAVTLNPDDFR